MNGMCPVCEGFGMILNPMAPGYSKPCPECYAPVYPIYSLQDFARDVEREEPGYAEAIREWNDRRKAREDAENANCAVRGIMRGESDLPDCRSG